MVTLRIVAVNEVWYKAAMMEYKDRSFYGDLWIHTDLPLVLLMCTEQDKKLIFCMISNVNASIFLLPFLSICNVLRI